MKSDPPVAIRLERQRTAAPSSGASHDNGWQRHNVFTQSGQTCVQYDDPDRRRRIETMTRDDPGLGAGRSGRPLRVRGAVGGAYIALGSDRIAGTWAVLVGIAIASVRCRCT
jgi:hypothetical protein